MQKIAPLPGIEPGSSGWKPNILTDWTTGEDVHAIRNRIPLYTVYEQWYDMLYSLTPYAAAMAIQSIFTSSNFFLFVKS